MADKAASVVDEGGPSYPMALRCAVNDFSVIADCRQEIIDSLQGHIVRSCLSHLAVLHVGLDSVCSVEPMTYGLPLPGHQ